MHMHCSFGKVCWSCLEIHYIRCLCAGRAVLNIYTIHVGQIQKQHSLSVPNKLGQARVQTHQEPQVTVQALQQLLSKHSYSNIDLQVYPRLSNLFLLPSPMSISVYLYISSHYQLVLVLHNALLPLEVSFGHGQTTSTDVGQAFLQLVLPPRWSRISSFLTQSILV